MKKFAIIAAASLLASAPAVAAPAANAAISNAATQLSVARAGTKSTKSNGIVGESPILSTALFVGGIVGVLAIAGAIGDDSDTGDNADSN
jgi:hypothetical protein